MSIEIYNKYQSRGLDTIYLVQASGSKRK